jgi:hypothetical protein
MRIEKRFKPRPVLTVLRNIGYSSMSKNMHDVRWQHPMILLKNIANGFLGRIECPVNFESNLNQVTGQLEHQ